MCPHWNVRGTVSRTGNCELITYMLMLLALWVLSISIYVINSQLIAYTGDSASHISVCMWITWKTCWNAESASQSEVEPEILHFSLAPRRCRCCWLRTTCGAPRLSPHHVHTLELCSNPWVPLSALSATHTPLLLPNKFGTASNTSSPPAEEVDNRVWGNVTSTPTVILLSLWQDWL